MKISLQKILAVNELFEKNFKVKLPIKTAYKIAKITDVISTEVVFYNTELQKIIDEFAERDGNGSYALTDDKQGIKVKDGELQKCEEKINELAMLEVDIAIEDKKLKLDDLEQAGLELTLQEVSLLTPFLKE